MNKTKIEWCDYTWNPLTGCKHDCPYCYARKVAKRFEKKPCPACNGDKGILFHLDTVSPATEFKCLKCRGRGTVGTFEKGFIPQFHPDRLGEPAKRKKPTKIFVVSMGDLFGEWVPKEWIEQVFKACEAAPWHTFFFLTKNSAQYHNFSWKTNWWRGASVTNQNEMLVLWDKFYFVRRHQTFISVEPIQGPVLIPPHTIHRPNWVIVGSETRNGRPVNVPKKEWILDIREQCKDLGIPLFEKNSLLELMDDKLIQEWPNG